MAPLLMETEVTLWVLLDYLGLSGRLLCSKETVGKRAGGRGAEAGFLVGAGLALRDCLESLITGPGPSPCHQA